MIVDYIALVNAAYNTFKDNDLFNPEAEPSQRLINQLRRTRHIPGPPFPVITIKLANSRDLFRTLGYTPWLALALNVTIWCSLPSTGSTPRILTDLGLDNISDDWESEQELLYIQSKFEEWMRGDETVAGKSRRALGCDAISGLNSKIAKRSQTVFDEKKVGNITIRSADNLITFDFARVL